jgi:polar amino acid transport system substrate-binding protein
VREELRVLVDLGRSNRGVSRMVATLVLLVGLTGCGSDEPTPPADDTGAPANGIEAPTDLVRDGEFTVCTDPSYPPLEYFDEAGEFDGFDVAVARAVGEKWGIEVRFHETAFSGILPALDAGRCDVAWSGLFLDPERTEAFSAVPYQETTSVILVQAGNPAGITSPDDLSGKTVASQNGTNLLNLARDISAELEAEGKPPSNVQGYDRFNEAIQQLLVGRADAVITQDIDAAFRALEQPGTFESVYNFPDAETFGVYYVPTNEDLGEKLYQALKQLEDEGELVRIAEEEGMPPDGIKIEEPVGP